MSFPYQYYIVQYRYRYSCTVVPVLVRYGTYCMTDSSHHESTESDMTAAISQAGQPADSSGRKVPKDTLNADRTQMSDVQPWLSATSVNHITAVVS